MQSITIGPNQAGQRFDKFLHKYFPQAGSGFLYKMLRKKNITLNGKKAEGKEILQEGDEVKLFFAQETFAKLKGTADHVSPASNYHNAFLRLKGISVLYEDSHVLILNKPAGILTQKASDNDLSLNEWMIGYLLEKQSITPEELQSFKPSVCNRLDRNTSGIVLCGKSLAGSQALSKLIHDRDLRKFYRTIVVGHVKEETHIDGYLVKNQRTNTVKIYPSFQSCPVNGDMIKTAYIPLKKILLPKAHSFDLTYLEVELLTGKTHQIRAHLSSAGHPLIGDAKYGKPSVNTCFLKEYQLSHQLLHAFRLEFPHLEGTLSGLDKRIITAPLPEQFIKILKEESSD